MGYLWEKFKGKYRIRCDICEDTNDFPRKIDDTYEDIDCYILCNNNIRIFYYGKGILQVYIPSTTTANNILKFFYRDNINESNTRTSINEHQVKINDRSINAKRETITIIDQNLYKEEINNNNIIFDIEKTDSEMLFKFKTKYMDVLEKYLQPKTYGANISPFSVKNRPKIAYIIPDEDLVKYKLLTSDLPQNKLILIGKLTKDFIKSMSNKKLSYKNIKSDMALKCLRGKEYIHSIGKWNDYIKYLEKEICQI